MTEAGKKARFHTVQNEGQVIYKKGGKEELGPRFYAYDRVELPADKAPHAVFRVEKEDGTTEDRTFGYQIVWDEVKPVKGLGFVTTSLRLSDVELIERYSTYEVKSDFDQKEKTEMLHELLMRMGNFVMGEFNQRNVGLLEQELDKAVEKINHFKAGGKASAVNLWLEVANRLGWRIGQVRPVRASTQKETIPKISMRDIDKKIKRDKEKASEGGV